MSALRWLPTLASVGGRQERGMTVEELRLARGWHHGIASGVLSHLHREGRLARLIEQRNGNKVYVVPEYIAGRDTEPHRHHRRKGR